MAEDEPWLEEIIQGPLNVAWPDQADEWLYHLSTTLCEAFESSSSGYGLRSVGAPFPHLEYTHHDRHGGLGLWLVTDRDGVRCLLAGTGTIDAAKRQTWIQAIETATDRVGRAHTEMPWNAVIGTDPDDVDAPLAALAAPQTIAGLHLTPAGVYVQEWRPHIQPALHTRMPIGSWPIIVEGTDRRRGYVWWTTLAVATRRLYRLCALLSVAWGSCWLLRASPIPTDLSRHDLPASPPYGPPLSQGDEDALPRDDRTIPGWVEPAWALLDSDPRLADALIAHHEGLRLLQHHPSWATVAFVASIEAIGARSGSRDGAFQRFRDALARVVPTEDATGLARAVYRHRSGTVHAGKVHGMEPAFGSFSGVGLFAPDRHFDVRVVPRLRAISRSLLETELGRAVSVASHHRTSIVEGSAHQPG